MGIFGKKVNYREIGRTADADTFFQKLESVMPSERKTRALLDGAAQAFKEGHPENVQRLFQTPQSLSAHWSRYALYTLTQSADDAAAVVALAFSKAPGETRRAVLSNMLVDIIYYHGGDLHQNADLIEAVLKNGADANVKLDGFAGTLLAVAAVNDAPQTVLDLLFEYGADANGALDRANNRAYNSRYIIILSIYKERQDKQNANKNTQKADARPLPEEDLHATLQEIKENIRDLTAAIGILAERIDAQQPAGNTPAQPKQKKSYPKL